MARALQRARRSRRRRVGRQPATPSGSRALRDLAAGRVAGGVLRRPVQRGRRRAGRRHRPDAAPDREPDALPAAARPRPAQGSRTRPSAPCSTSSARTAESSGSTGATGPCSAAPARDVERAVEDGFPFLPAGCHMELDRVASEIVLRSLREAIPSRWPAKVDELRSLQPRDAAT